ncbi:chemotaxis protein CheW [Acidovorax sp. NCPPB 4044]|uniref:chemotaxis protein CheW n=1 Tax=Acidovorax sp. NCPPB 4044 TaxID=2940490 RepID=UPI002304C8A6|nr:chemotaxis protein CheW [Acidovorax sp. NCPPB 4044]MDA8522067.1 cache domain-containing protein [Acidovorax sp. NCPPB 4044]
MSSSTTLSAEEWLRYMPTAQQQRQELRLVEGAWDHLALLSSLSLLSSKASSGGDLARARKDFAALSQELMHGLAGEALRNRLDDLTTRAQICIDVLVRNLFERTADIGFFATDGALTRYLAEGLPGAEARPQIEARLRSYADKYTVYGGIFLFDTHGVLRASLQPSGSDGALEDASQPSAPARDLAFLRSVIGSDAAYVEHYGRHGFSAQQAQTLVYARRVTHQGQPVGVLCLEFRLADEMPAIFASLQGAPEGGGHAIDAVLALADAQGRILASSDLLQLPVGWRVPEAANGAPADGQVVRHMGRRYLLVARPTQGFQGYGGPGWRGLALLPLDGAFDDAMELSGERAGVAGQAELLSEGLRGIPVRSAAIQSALERSVWNGLLDLEQIGGTEATSRERGFARALLSEIGATARRTARVFSAALEGLYGVATRSLLSDAQSRGLLAMQILDRNLYERANDCRWWALAPQFADTLAAGTADCAASAAVLREINALYTVYSGLVLFDRGGRVVAVSQPAHAHHVGTVLDEPWVARCLQLPSEQSYTVSDYAASRLHADGPTFVYAAAVRAPRQAGDHGRGGEVLGGVGVVWDAGRQLDSILADCAVGLGGRDALAFVDAAGAVVRSAGPAGAGADGGVLPAALEVLRTAPAERMVDVRGHWYGMGVAFGQGYREFRTEDGYEHGLRCVVLRHLCASARHAEAAGAVPAPLAAAAHADPGFALQVATFMAAGHWFGIDAAQVVAAAPDAAVLHAGGARPPFLGLAQIGERVCPVVDMHTLVATTRQAPAVSRQADANRQLIVLRVPLEGARQAEFALRVDALGPMLDVDRRQMQPVPWSAAAGAQEGPSLVDTVLAVPVEGDRPAKRMLCRIGTPWLQQCAAGAAGAAQPLDVAALLAAG